jgi:hypothetical protein
MTEFLTELPPGFRRRSTEANTVQSVHKLDIRSSVWSYPKHESL